MHIQLHQLKDLTQLQQQNRQQRDAKQRDRYRTVLLALEGHHAPTIARTLGRSRAFVQRWVYAYRDHGLQTIAPKRRTRRCGSGPAFVDGGTGNLPYPTDAL